MRHVLGALCIVASPAFAENVLDSHFGNPALPSSGCFVRSYSNSHLAKHPDQVATEIAVMVSALSSGGSTPLLDVFVTLRVDREQYHGLAACKTKAKGLTCLLEGDAGGFTLTGENNGAPRLTVGRQGMGLEGDNLVEISGTQGDDRAFLIPNVPGDQCNQPRSASASHSPSAAASWA